MQEFAADTVEISYSDNSDDLYSSDLKNQLVEALGRRNINPNLRQYHVDRGNRLAADIYQSSRDACDVGKKGAVLYVGRAKDLREYLKGMYSFCREKLPNVIAGDDVARFRAD
ncbi:MAG: hypothetical protein ACRDRV_04560 [Pseudonocardiaceae bacterium]